MVTLKRKPLERARGIGERAFGAARSGLHAGRGAFELGKKTFETGKRFYGAGRRVMGWREAEEAAKESRTLTERGEESVGRISVEEEKESMRMRNLQKILGKRLPPEVAEELGELIQEAAQQEISGMEMHKLLADFFSERYTRRSRDNIININGWIRTVLRVTHPDYAAQLKVD